MNRIHHYSTTTTWQGNSGQGTSNYASYGRNYLVSADNKPAIECSADPAFRGDKTRYNPEDLMVAAASACHMLTYLHLCAVNGVVVTDYKDKAEGAIAEDNSGGGRFTEIMLNPVVTVKEQAMVAKAEELHHKAGELCFIANSSNFPIKHKPVIKVAE